MMTGTLVVEEEIVMSNRRVGLAWCVAATLALALPAGAAAQAAQPAKPANATGECKDGTFTTAKSKSGACSGHGGVATWYAAADAKAASKDASKDTKAAAKDAKADTKAAAKDAKADTKAATKEASTDTKAATKEASTDTKAAAKDAKADTKTASTDTKSTSKAPTVARPADAPPDSTAQCNDGTYSKSTHHSGTCAGHKGVKAWFK
jgi:hypothetical protein